jgi:hypothetical protein
MTFRMTSKENGMKKLAICAMAAVVAGLSFSTAADAAPKWQHRGFHNGWHHGWNNGARWRHGWHNGWRWHRGWRSGWRHGYWGGPRIVIGPAYDGYCFIKKVHRHDRYGNVYVRRVRICD